MTDIIMQYAIMPNTNSKRVTKINLFWYSLYDYLLNNNTLDWIHVFNALKKTFFFCVEKDIKDENVNTPTFQRHEVEHLIAIQFTNGFEINVVDICGRAFYPTISRVNHSCIPNVSHANVKKNGSDSSMAQNKGRL